MNRCPWCRKAGCSQVEVWAECRAFRENCCDISREHITTDGAPEKADRQWGTMPCVMLNVEIKKKIFFI